MARRLSARGRRDPVQLESKSAGRIAASVLALALALPAVAAEPRAPDAVMGDMNRAVLEELSARGADLDRDPGGLYALARVKVRPNFDLEYTARLIVGPAWQSASPSARVAFVEAFERYLVSSYARALLFVRAETLTVLGPPRVTGPTHSVLPLRVLMDDGARVETEVHFRLDDGAWRIWDVRASGISFVRQYRGDFGTEARIRGLEACTESLQQIAQRNEMELRDRQRETGSIRRAR